MTRTYSVSDIARLSDIPIRTVRYVLDHNLTSKRQAAKLGVGRTRQLKQYDAFAVAVAATLVCAGISSRQITQLFRALGPSGGKLRKLLYGTYTGNLDLILSWRVGISLDIDSLADAFQP